MEKVINKLCCYIEEKDEENAALIEDMIADSFEEAINEESFYSLPMKNILNITKKCSNDNKEVYKTLIERTCEVKGEESALLLYYINPDMNSLNDYIDIISSFSQSPVLQNITKLFKDDINQTERDYEYELEKLKRSNEELKKQVEELKEKESQQFRPRIVSMRVGIDRK